MRIAVQAETDADESRVAATPDTAKALIALGAEVAVEAGAGRNSAIPDEAYAGVGASVAPNAAAAVSGADVVLRVRRPSAAELEGVKPGAVVLAILDPYEHVEELRSLAGAGVSAFAMELIPRITRAQAMDVLSSQANLAGYRAIIDAASAYDRAIPMMTTAAGSVPPARIFIMGVGVAGLQAIATARRIGGVVTATDVRPATKEQVLSLGAKFIAVEDEEFAAAETAAGYAKPMSAEYQAKQAALTASHIAKQDIVVTTALIPGRAAPVLITADMVRSMQPGSVIVDLAVERGGNCELSRPGETVVSDNGVKIIGNLNVAGRVPATASALYARNLLAFLKPLIDPATKELAINWDDEIVKATVLTRDGALPHPDFQAPPEAPAKDQAAEMQAELPTAASVAPAERTVPELSQETEAAPSPDAGPLALTNPAAKSRQKTKSGKSSNPPAS
jgi:H+-translocating NAD(P) transhydrogenase subunit alpha